MQLARPGIALDPKRFGRGQMRQQAATELPAAVSDDLKLFGTTFVAGFVFVSLLLV
jgi:hypothetical protein